MLDALSRPSHLTGGGKGRGGWKNKQTLSLTNGRSCRWQEHTNTQTGEFVFKAPHHNCARVTARKLVDKSLPSFHSFPVAVLVGGWKSASGFFFPLFRYNAQRLIFPAVFCFPWPALSHTPKHFPLKIKAKKKKIEGCWALLPACCFDALGRDIPTWPMRIFLTRTRQSLFPDFSAIFRTIFLLLPHANSRLTTARRSKQADSRLVLRRCCFC